MTPGSMRAAARAHRQPVDRREAHRAGHAAAGGQRAHAGAVAQVQHHGAPLRGRRVELRQHRGDVLVGQAVEAVAAHAGVVQLPGQREHLRQLGLRAVERGVEAGHLRQLRLALEQQPDRRQVVRLVQRRERNELRQVVQHLARRRAPAARTQPAVHDAVPDAGQAAGPAACRAGRPRCARARRRGRAACPRPRRGWRWSRRRRSWRRSAARCGCPRPGRAPSARGRRRPARTART